MTDSQLDVGRGADLLDGISVVELSNGPPGMQAGQFLADFGAQVIQVEPPGGSALRSHPAWPFWGRGKRAVQLDLRDAADASVARTLACRSDVVIETFRPGVADRLGLGYDDLAEQNPGLVYGSITGFGRKGPLADLQGYEAIVQAKLGVFSSLSDMSERQGPSFASAPYASFPAAQLAIQGILSALYERESSGRGQHVETTLAQGITVHDTFNWFSRVVAARFPEAYVPAPLAVRGVPSGGLSFRLLIALTADGRWIQFSQTVERLFRAMMQMLGLDWMFEHPDWSTAPDFDDPDKRVAFWEQLLEKVRARTLAEWRSLFDAFPDVWAEVFSRDNEVLEHPQVVWNDMVMTLADPARGAVRQPTPAVKVEFQPVPSRPAPRLGEYDAEIRRAAEAPAARRARPAATRDPAPARTPLEGVTVLELGTYYAAPYGATLLADLGARVIKLEQLDGDPHRHMLPFPEVAGMKVLQGKESVAVDVGSEEGREIAYGLVRGADIVLQSFRAGVAERLKVDPASLRNVNPRLIYHSAPGYGVGGPCGHRPAFAPTIGAAAGLAWRNAGATIPERPDLTMDEIKSTAMRLALAVMGVGNSDGFAGVTVGSALVLGLLARQRGRPAPNMLTTMISSSMHALSDVMTRYPGQDPAPAADPDLLGFGPLYRLYETADGWIFLAAPTDRDWRRLSSVITHLGADHRFASALDRSANASDLAVELGKWFLQKPAAELEILMRAADVACVEVASGPVDSHFLEKGSLGQECGFVTSALQPILDEAPRLAPLVRFSRSSTRVGGACLCGQHTDAVLAELGYDQDQISNLRAAGIIGG